MLCYAILCYTILLCCSDLEGSDAAYLLRHGSNWTRVLSLLQPPPRAARRARRARRLGGLGTPPAGAGAGAGAEAGAEAGNGTGAGGTGASAGPGGRARRLRGGSVWDSGERSGHTVWSADFDGRGPATVGKQRMLSIV
jgi:hypothetical protein